MLPVKDTVPARSFPVVNWLLIAANVVLFFVELSLGPDAEALTAALGVVPTRLLANRTLGQLATLVTSMFLHGGWLHLLGNMLADVKIPVLSDVQAATASRGSRLTV